MTHESRAFAYQVTLTRSVIVRLIAYSVLLLWLAYEIFSATTDWVLPSLSAAAISASVLVYATALALHEWVHGAGMRLFGARPEYGVMVIRRVLPVAYATAPGHRFTLQQMVIIRLLAVPPMPRCLCDRSKDRAHYRIHRSRRPACRRRA
jgi:hypothetical protein